MPGFCEAIAAHSEDPAMLFRLMASPIRRECLPGSASRCRAGAAQRIVPLRERCHARSDRRLPHSSETQSRAEDPARVLFYATISYGRTVGRHSTLKWLLKGYQISISDRIRLPNAA